MKRTITLLLCAVLSTVVGYAQNFVIPVETDSKGYYIVIEEDGRAWHGYFGDKINNYDQFADVFLATHPKVNELKTPLYPTFGGGYIGEPALKLTHADGNMTTRLVYDSHKSETLEGGNLIQTDVILRDEYYPLTVTLRYKAYQNEDIFAISTTIYNGEKKSIRIDGAMSNYLSIKAEEYWLSRYYGAWSGEMQMVESPIADGITTIDNKRGVRTTQDGSPTFILSLNQPASETVGEVIIGSLAWSGNYKMNLEVNYQNKLHISAGINDYLSAYTLDKGESFETPEFVLAHSSNGVGNASRNLHRWVRNYNIQDGDKVRPIVLNSWEGAYFDFDENVIKKMIADAASMGIEMFVLDDGWFGVKYPRDNAKAGLGDWEINYKKLPNGLKGLIECAEEHNVDFGLWVEPEMVNPKSKLAEQHPEWIVTSANRSHILERDQLLLDLSNPKVKEFVYNVVASYLREYPEIKYIKWDANRHVEDFGSTYLAKDKQSHFWINYIKNLYKVYDSLSKEFPDVIFQACSSGAGRIDYGSLKYHHEVWGSDNTDAKQRVFINWGINQFLPAQAVASHVSQSPNHQTDQVTPIKFRFDVAMAQRLGVELQPTKLTPEELEWTKEGIAVYKEKIRPIVQLGDQYRLISPYEGNGFSSTMYVNDDKSKSIVFVYSIDFHFRDVYPTIKLQGLDPNKNYRVEELMPAIGSNGKARSCYRSNGEVLSGDMLMKFGMTLTLQQQSASGVFMLSEVK